MQLTNAREIGAFFLARLVAMGMVFVLAGPVLVRIYVQLSRSGSVFLLTPIGCIVNGILWLITFGLFVALRARFSGAPPRVSGGRRDAATSSAGEIAAFVIASLMMIALDYVLDAFVVPSVYDSLQQSGETSSINTMLFGVSMLSSLVCFPIFIAVRRAMPGAAPSEESTRSYDEDGLPVGFGGAIATCLCKYAVFKGRASRSEFWYFVLFQVLLFVVLSIIDAAVFRGAAPVLVWLAALLLFVPGLAVTVRRLHDGDISGWWALLALIPLFGLYILVWLWDPGTKGPNRFGMGPGAIPDVFA